MISITNLAMNYGSKLLFTDVSLNLNPKHRYGLVGSNGCGKSTFLKLLAQEEEAAFGEINVPTSTRIGFLRQDQFLYEHISVLDSVISGRAELWEAIQEKNKLLELEVCDDKVGYRLGELEQIICDNDGYTAEIFAAELLVGLGIKEEYHHQPLSTLSGGYKLRVLLAQSLFNDPDVLLLDEPTNHLDILSIYWLEGYLKQKFKGVLIFISHDVAFLNNTSTHTLDIDYGEIRQYTGNYDMFAREKKLVDEQKRKDLNNVEKKIAHMRVFIDKFRSGTRAKQSLSREKQIDKIELPDVQKSSRISPYFNFKQKRPSGKLTLTVEGVAKSYAEKLVLNRVNFTLTRGEKVIIIGPNGIGKSTLLKIILGKTEADKGAYEWGHESQISYFAQDHHDLLNENMTAFDWLSSHAGQGSDIVVRRTLGQVLFRQDEAHKNVMTLSGGEGGRLLLAKTMIDEGNVLVLDEPTNHLDIEAKDALRKALLSYPGTLLLVTHDRDFASSIATRIIALTEKGITDFPGTYQEYLDKHGNDYLNNTWTVENKPQGKSKKGRK